jgi:hypothetical protein
VGCPTKRSMRADHHPRAAVRRGAPATCRPRCRAGARRGISTGRTPATPGRSGATCSISVPGPRGRRSDVPARCAAVGTVRTLRAGRWPPTGRIRSPGPRGGAAPGNEQSEVTVFRRPDAATEERSAVGRSVPCLPAPAAGTGVRPPFLGGPGRVRLSDRRPDAAGRGPTRARVTVHVTVRGAALRPAGSTGHSRDAALRSRRRCDPRSPPGGVSDE